jgi:integrase
VSRKARRVRIGAECYVDHPEVRRLVSPAQINRELATLKRIFNLARQSGKVLHVPHIPMLREDNVRRGFFEPEQYQSLLNHLPEVLQSIVTFAYITGWRIASEVLPLQWRQIDFDASEVRLEAGTTKNGEGRVFPMTRDLRALLKAQNAQREALATKGVIVPWVFFRMVLRAVGATSGRGRCAASPKRSRPPVRRLDVPAESPMTFVALRSAISCGQESLSVWR